MNFRWQANEYHTNSSIQYHAATELLQQLTFTKSDMILDIGCGDGKITTEISLKTNGNVLGIDISPEMIAFAKNCFSEISYPNLTFVLQDANFLNYTNDFDLIFSSFAIQWIVDLDDFIKKAHKSLKVSGRIAFTIPLGISIALEQAIDEITHSHEWLAYFNQFTVPWKFPNECNLHQILTQNRFSISRFSKIDQIDKFESRESLKKYISQWLAHLQHIPPSSRDLFLNKIVDKYCEIEPILDTGEILFTFPRLDIIAQKSKD